MSDADFSTQHTIERDAPARRSSRAVQWMIGVVSAIAVLSGIGFAISSSKGTSPTLSAVAAASAASPSSSVVRPTPIAYELQISPEDAHVTVDGRSVPITNGTAHLDGQPGDMFVIDVIAHDNVRKTERVFITSDRRLEPPRIVLEASAPATSVAIAVAEPTTRRSAAAKPSSSSSSTLSPPPPPSSSAVVPPPIKARETW